MKTSLHYSAKKLALLIFAIIIPALTFAQWNAPVNLSPNAMTAGLNESMGSCIGTSGDTVHVVWTDKRSATAKINVLYYTRSLDSGLTWSTPVAITSMTSNAWNPAIAVNGSSVHVVWREMDTVANTRASYYKHSLDGGNTWGPNVYLDLTADWPAVAVSGNTVYMVNDSVTAASPYNTEIFFMRSLNNGVTWSAKQQLSFAVGRSEDEAIHAEGSHIHMSWNDNRSGQFQILYKESADYGVTWGPDVVVTPKYDYSTMVWSDGAHVDVVSAGRPINNHYQIELAQSADTGATWASSIDITHDTLNSYFYPDMVRNGSDLHVVCSGSAGANYLHSGDGGATWDSPFIFTGSSTFVAYTYCAVHIIYVDANKKINYLRNPTGNAGHCAAPTSVEENNLQVNISVYPNPASGIINLKMSQFENMQIKIYNVYGECIYQHISTSAHFQIDLGSQPNGIYFLNVKTEKDSFTKKIIIQK